MSITKYLEEFEKQVVREVLEKVRTIDSTMTSYDLVPQIVKACIVKCRKRCASVQDVGAVESVAVIKLGAVKVGEKYVSDKTCLVLQRACRRLQCTEVGTKLPGLLFRIRLAH